MVVFPPHVLIFSDKNCHFPETGDIRTRWRRWYRKAVLESAEQIWGAERWIKKFPERLFLDEACSVRFPLRLPLPTEAIFHRIVVAHDGARVCKELLGGSGSFMLDPATPPDGSGMPFMVGDLDPGKGFVHVFDDTSLRIILSTLDTVSDLVRYLQEKEKLFRSGRLGVAPGEEELLAVYLMHSDDDGEHCFPPIEGADSFSIADEGLWLDFTRRPERQAQIAHDEISYTWDSLIETFNANVLGGTLAPGSADHLSDNELVLRHMAAENRTRRRSLSRALLGFIQETPPTRRALRVIPPVRTGRPHYLFVLLPLPPPGLEIDYREVRRNFVQDACTALKAAFPSSTSVVAIATESGRLLTGSGSEDALYCDFSSWTDEHQAEAERTRRDLDLFTNLTMWRVNLREYPVESDPPLPQALSLQDPCPCKSGRAFGECCGPR